VQINKVCVAVARELAGFVWAIASTRAKLAHGRIRWKSAKSIR